MSTIAGALVSSALSAAGTSVGNVLKTSSGGAGISEILPSVSKVANNVASAAQTAVFGKPSLNSIDAAPLSIAQAATFGGSVSVSGTAGSSTPAATTPWYKKYMWWLIGGFAAAITILFFMFRKKRR